MAYGNSYNVPPGGMMLDRPATQEDGGVPTAIPKVPNLSHGALFNEIVLLRSQVSEELHMLTGRLDKLQAGVNELWQLHRD